MGDGNYHDDVRTAQESIGTTRAADTAFDYSARATSGHHTGVHPDLNPRHPRHLVRESNDTEEHPLTTPIAVVMDVTKSRGNDARVIYEQVPSFLGAIKVSGIVTDPQILWVAVGDANTDRAPLQVGHFESDRRIDLWLRYIWMEGGGGGTGEESYELAAYKLARQTRLDANDKRNVKAFCFITGDEAPYPVVSREFVKQHMGDELPADLPTEQIFEELQRKYHVFLIFPRATMAQRQGAIDEEIRQRLVLAGGRFDKVSIRASLLWDNRNDLDLHCITPGGEHICYSHKNSRCGGELDVDRNVRGEDPKPVENIRWPKGLAKPGRYQFYVENYRYHERDQGPIPFRAELDIDGKIETFKGEIPAGATHEKSRIVLFDFVYKPGDAEQVDQHANYEDAVILDKWGKYLPKTHILRIQDPASCVEVMLGAMALQSGKQTLDQFAAGMVERRVPADRQRDVREALELFARQGVFHEVAGDLFV